MKARFLQPGLRAFTVIELIVIIAVLALLILFLIPESVRAPRRARLKSCQDNLKQVGLAFRVSEAPDWQFLMSSPGSLGGTKEMVNSGLVFVHLRVMANELVTPKILVCPADRAKLIAANFTSLSDTNVSYFVGTDARDTYPQMFLSGDRNLAFNREPLKPGLFFLATNNAASLSWSEAIHNSCGNILLADGSVQFLDSKQLVAAAQNQDYATNRLAIP